MIHPASIREFMEKPRDSFAWVKDLSEREVDRELDRLGFKPCRPKKPLDLHQKVCVMLGLAYPQFAFWLDMGTGKTRLILEILRYLFDEGILDRALILVPSEQAVYTWEQQNEEWHIDLPLLALDNQPSADKWNAIAEFEKGLVVATYPGLVWMCCEKKKAKGKDKVKLKPNPRLIKKMSLWLNALVFDESTELGNHGSLATRICRKLSQTCEYRFALAGRPFGKDPTKVWSQQFLVDHGESLGETLGLFRAGFFDEKKGYFGGYEYKFRKDLEPKLAEFMQHRAITYASSECMTLPPVTDIEVEVKLPLDAVAYYQKMLEVLRAAKGDYVQTKNTFLRMRQLSSGFIGYKDDETGERAQMTFPTNPKLDRTLELASEVPLDRKFVIFHEFTYSGRKLMEGLEGERIKADWLWSGTKDSKATLRRFDNDPKLRGLVINHKLGAMSLNLQVANYEFVYESPLGVIDFDQMKRRCFRKGQKRPGFLYLMLAKGTVDRRILEWHAKGESLFKALLRDPYGIAA